MDRRLEQLGLDQLSVEERLDLIELLWASLTDEEAIQSIPEWHRQELDCRLAEHEANPDAGSSWEEVKARRNWPS